MPQASCQVDGSASGLVHAVDDDRVAGRAAETKRQDFLIGRRIVSAWGIGPGREFNDHRSLAGPLTFDDRRLPTPHKKFSRKWRQCRHHDLAVGLELFPVVQVFLKDHEGAHAALYRRGAFPVRVGRHTELPRLLLNHQPRICHIVKPGLTSPDSIIAGWKMTDDTLTG